MTHYIDHAQGNFGDFMDVVYELRDHLEDRSDPVMASDVMDGLADIIVSALLSEACGEQGIEGIESPIIKRVLQVYETGGFVVGWRGRYPRGQLVVYWRHDEEPVFK